MRPRLIAIATFSCGLLFLVAYMFAANPIVQDSNEAGQSTDNVSEQEPKKADDTQLYMRAKLANSQEVIEGLVTEDFEMIADGAKQMKRIAEAAHWPKTIDEVYQHYSVAFRNQCDKLVEQAERQDLQAAHYTYLHMSTTCVDCHSYVRRRFKIDRKTPNGPIQLIPTQWDGRKQKIKPPQPDDEDDKKG